MEDTDNNDFHVNYLLDNSVLYQPADKCEHNN